MSLSTSPARQPKTEKRRSMWRSKWNPFSSSKPSLSQPASKKAQGAFLSPSTHGVQRIRPTRCLSLGISRVEYLGINICKRSHENAVPMVGLVDRYTAWVLLQAQTMNMQASHALG